MRRRDLDPDRWARLAPLLDQALDLPPDQRVAFLERACIGDEECRSLLLSFISSAEREDGPLDRFPSSTAAALLEDLRGTSDGLPITARPPRSTHGSGRFIRRHRAAISAAGLAVAVLAGYAWILSVGTNRAREEVARMEEALRRSERIVAFLRSIVAPPGGNPTPGSPVARANPDGEPTIRQALDRAATEVAREPGDDPALAARAHTIIGEGYLALGAPAAAESHLRAAVLILEKAGLSHDLSEPLGLLSRALRELGRSEEAERALDRAGTLEKARDADSMPAVPR